jgi:hypothetical protein
MMKAKSVAAEPAAKTVPVDKIVSLWATVLAYIANSHRAGNLTIPKTYLTADGSLNQERVNAKLRRDHKAGTAYILGGPLNKTQTIMLDRLFKWTD